MEHQSRPRERAITIGPRGPSVTTSAKRLPRRIACATLARNNHHRPSALVFEYMRQVGRPCDVAMWRFTPTSVHDWTRNTARARARKSVVDVWSARGDHHITRQEMKKVEHTGIDGTASQNPTHSWASSRSPHQSLESQCAPGLPP